MRSGCRNPQAALKALGDFGKGSHAATDNPNKGHCVVTASLRARLFSQDFELLLLLCCVAGLIQSTISFALLRHSLLVEGSLFREVILITIDEC